MPVPVLGGSKDLGLVRGLGLLAAAAIVIGDVIGTGVFLKARVMTCNVGTPGLVVTVWVVAGLLSLAGALTYAELAAMMPRAGGEYVFIRRAYGSAVRLSLRMDAVFRGEHRRHRGSRRRVRHFHQHPGRRCASGARR